MKVASSPEAGLLGSSWVIILRCLSLLEALQVHHKQSGMPPYVSGLFCRYRPCTFSSALCLHACGLGFDIRGKSSLRTA